MYDLHLGPLSFLCPLDTVSKTLGDSLENVGAALVAGERRARPLKLKLPVEGDPHDEPDPRAAGDRLQRQVSQLLDNRRWLSHGLYLYWEPGPDLLAGWLMLGGGELAEQEPGVSFGMYSLDLSDPFLAGKVGTHRRGRRLDLADRRGGLVPRDSRGLLYSGDFSTSAALDYPLVLPGSVRGHVYSSRANRARLAGPTRLMPDGVTRTLWEASAAIDGEVITYVPDPTKTDPDPRRAPLVVDDVGSVKAWDMNLGAGGGFTGDPIAATSAADYSPDVAYGWERLLGSPERVDRYLALENGSIRLRWLGGGLGAEGAADAGGLIFECWDEAWPGGGRYVPEGRFINGDLGAGNANWEVTIAELTPERGVLEVRSGDRAMRVILQRGWASVRIESYLDRDDASAIVVLDYSPAKSTGGLTVGTGASGPPYFLDNVTVNRAAPRVSPATVLSAPATDGYSFFGGSGWFPSPCVRWFQGATNLGAGEPNAVVAQFGGNFRAGTVEAARNAVAPLAALSLVDCRSVPVLVSR